VGQALACFETIDGLRVENTARMVIRRRFLLAELAGHDADDDDDLQSSRVVVPSPHPPLPPQQQQQQQSEIPAEHAFDEVVVDGYSRGEYGPLSYDPKTVRRCRHGVAATKHETLRMHMHLIRLTAMLLPRYFLRATVQSPLWCEEASYRWYGPCQGLERFRRRL
jgi:hypothetical protein